MDKAFATTLAPSRCPPANPRPAPHWSDLTTRNALLTAECFRQFGIEAVPVTTDAAERLRKEKFEACVLASGWRPTPKP